MFCQKCGKELREGAVFCDSCGAQQEERQDNIMQPQPVYAIPQPIPYTPPNPVKKPTKKIVFGIISVVVVIIILGITVLFPITKNDNDSNKYITITQASYTIIALKYTPQSLCTYSGYIEFVNESEKVIDHVNFYIKTYTNSGAEWANTYVSSYKKVAPGQTGKYEDSFKLVTDYNDTPIITSMYICYVDDSTKSVDCHFEMTRIAKS